jgi:hypothetical protein
MAARQRAGVASLRVVTGYGGWQLKAVRYLEVMNIFKLSCEDSCAGNREAHLIRSTLKGSFKKKRQRFF